MPGFTSRLFNGVYVSDITPRTNEILKTIKEFNVEADKFLLSVEKVESALSCIEDDKNLSEDDLVKEVLEHNQSLNIVKKILCDFTLEELRIIQREVGTYKQKLADKKPKFTIPNDQLETEERGLYRPLTDFEGMN